MSRPSSADLVLCAHGTRDPDGARVLAQIAEAVAAALPTVGVRLAFADVQEPAVGDAVREHAGRGPLVVVPLLLSFGYHVETDVHAAVRAHRGAAAAPPVGPDPRLARLLADRLATAGAPAEQPVVLGVAGSSRARAVRDVETTRSQLSRLRPGGVVVGHGAARAPSVPEAVARLRRSGVGPVAVASYLLAPGHFHGVLQSAGADVVTEPLGATAAVVEIVVERYTEALRELPPRPRA